MTRNKPSTFLATAAVIPLTALAVAGCGGGGNDTAGSGAPPKTANGRAATVGVENSNLGKILDDTRGRTLYLFKKDSGTKSACAGACAGVWPPLRVSGKATVGAGATASMLRTTHRAPTARRRSSTTATRSTPTPATRTRATRTARA